MISSPVRADARTAELMAAMPDEKSSALSDPIISARRSSASLTVGLW